LVRGVNWLGDAVMTTPALLRLREAMPAAHITLLTHEKLADLWTHHPAVDDMLTFTRRDGVWSVARKLRSGNFRIGLALPNSHRAGLELWLAGIPRRVGGARPWRNWLFTQWLEPPAGFSQPRKRSTGEIKRLAGVSPSEGPIPSYQDPPPHAVHQL